MTVKIIVSDLITKKIMQKTIQTLTVENVEFKKIPLDNLLLEMVE